MGGTGDSSSKLELRTYRLNGVQGPGKGKLLEGAAHDAKDSEYLKSNGNLCKILRKSSASLLEMKQTL